MSPSNVAVQVSICRWMLPWHRISLICEVFLNAVGIALLGQLIHSIRLAEMPCCITGLAPGLVCWNFGGSWAKPAQKHSHRLLVFLLDLQVSGLEFLGCSELRRSLRCVVSFGMGGMGLNAAGWKFLTVRVPASFWLGGKEKSLDSLGKQFADED